MGTYGLDNVLRAWELEKITADQAIGQLLQLVAALHERVSELERDLNEHRRNGSSCGCQSGAVASMRKRS